MAWGLGGDDPLRFLPGPPPNRPLSSREHRNAGSPSNHICHPLIAGSDGGPLQFGACCGGLRASMPLVSGRLKRRSDRQQGFD